MLNKCYRLSFKTGNKNCSKIKCCKKWLANPHRLVGGPLLLRLYDYLSPLRGSRPAHLFIQRKNVFSDIIQAANTSEPQCYYKKTIGGKRNSRGGLHLHRSWVNPGFRTFPVCCSLTRMLPVMADLRLFSPKLEKRLWIHFSGLSISAKYGLLCIVLPSVVIVHLATNKNIKKNLEFPCFKMDLHFFSGTFYILELKPLLVSVSNHRNAEYITNRCESGSLMSNQWQLNGNHRGSVQRCRQKRTQ